MNPEKRDRLARAADLFIEVVDRPAEERQPYLEAACRGDQELRGLVEALLDQDHRGSILAPPSNEGTEGTDERFLTLSGQMLSRYQIIEQVGKGGMSTVYRARDKTLDRVVALKFLAPQMADDADATKRFEREARAAALLDHPNICPIYEIDRFRLRAFIAMAYLEGRTVADLLREGPLALERALDIAIQTCRGLTAAHEKGVVHRDIKPENLMVTEVASTGSLVRLLDFGIAHLAERTDPSEAGMAIGTVSYMAPEQIEGKQVDGRTDVWALGVVLYRMVSGVLPFQGESTRDVLAAILASDPRPLAHENQRLAPRLSGIVKKALQKDPARRHQTAEELLEELEALQAEVRIIDGPSVLQTVKRRRLLWAVLGASVLVGALIILTPKRIERPDRPLRPVPFTSLVGSEDHSAISPDGTSIAFTWDGESPSGAQDIYVKKLGANSLFQLTDTPVPEHSPAWSPDSKRIAFLRQLGAVRKLIVSSATGGAEVEVAEVRGTDQRWPELDWSPDGQFLATETEKGIVMISIGDLAQIQCSFPTVGDRDYAPRFDPLGRWLAFLRDNSTRPDTYHLYSLGGGGTRVLERSNHEDLLGSAGREFTWRGDGKALIYPGPSVGPGGPLFQLPISGGVASSLDIGERSARSPNVRAQMLTYTSHELETNIWALDLKQVGRAATPSDPVRLIASSVRDDTPQFSTDGRFIVFSSDRSGSQEIWRCDRSGRDLLQLTSIGGAHAGTPRVSPDGRWIAFDATLEDGESRIYLVGSGGGQLRPLTDGGLGGESLPSWAGDSRWVYFERGLGAEDSNVWKASLETKEAVQVTHGGGWESFERSNGKYLFYSKPSGLKEVRRLDLETGEETSFPELGSAGRWRYWAVGNTGIYFVDAFREPNLIQLLDFGTRETTIVGTIGRIIDGPGGLAVSPDESTILFVQRDRDDRDIMLVEHFE